MFCILFFVRLFFVVEFWVFCFLGFVFGLVVVLGCFGCGFGVFFRWFVGGFCCGLVSVISLLFCFSFGG